MTTYKSAYKTTTFVEDKKINVIHHSTNVVVLYADLYVVIVFYLSLLFLFILILSSNFYKMINCRSLYTP